MVEDRTLKWDATHPSYHKKTMKDQAFKDIAIALGFDGNGMYSLVVFSDEQPQTIKTSGIEISTHHQAKGLYSRFLEVVYRTCER